MTTKRKTRRKRKRRKPPKAISHITETKITVVETREMYHQTKTKHFTSLLTKKKTDLYISQTIQYNLHAMQGGPKKRVRAR